MGKKTALAILAATRMPAVTTVKSSNLGMAFSFMLRSGFAPNIPGYRVLVSNQGKHFQTKIPRPRSPRLHFSSIEKLPSCTWALRSGVSSMDAA
jgi:hypothetical protein